MIRTFTVIALSLAGRLSVILYTLLNSIEVLMSWNVFAVLASLAPELSGVAEEPKEATSSSMSLMYSFSASLFVTLTYLKAIYKTYHAIKYLKHNKNLRELQTRPSIPLGASNKVNHAWLGRVARTNCRL